MSGYRWVASGGIVLALVTAHLHYLAAPPWGSAGVVGYIARLGPLWSVGFGVVTVGLVLALVLGRLRYAAHVAAAACLSTYAAALWATAVVTGTHHVLVTAGLATALAIHALLMATVYSPGGAAWTRN